MRKPDRREVLRGGLVLGAAALLGPALGCRKRVEATDVAPRAAAGPRYFIQILMSGGHDTLYTTDPKRAGEVDARVALPTKNEIVTADGVALGPHYAELARHADRLAIVNGVQVRTVNHDTGFSQFFRLKTNVVPTAPTLLDLLTARRDGIPLGTAYLNVSHRMMHSPRYFGSADRFYLGKEDVFGQLAGASPDELRALAKLLRADAGRFAGRTGVDATTTAGDARDVAAFFERAAEVEPLDPFRRSEDYVGQAMSEAMERALWLIENDLAAGVVIDVGLLGWDTHQRNELKQAEMNGLFVACFTDLLAELKTRSNAHGVLADRTLVVAGSELGRFPQLNDMLGKDHLPQTSFLIAGPGVRAGKAYGATGRRLEGLPISYATGAPEAGGRIPVLDDLGATLLDHVGLDPERYGYTGQPLRFLFEKSA